MNLIHSKSLLPLKILAAPPLKLWSLAQYNNSNFG